MTWSRPPLRTGRLLSKARREVLQFVAGQVLLAGVDDPTLESGTAEAALAICGSDGPIVVPLVTTPILAATDTALVGSFLS